MKYRYTTKQGQFETNFYSEIPWDDLHSLNDKPALEFLSTGWKEWYFEGKIHRETGPARINNSSVAFWLNNKLLSFEEWCEIHPNKTALAIYLLKN